MQILTCWQCLVGLLLQERLNGVGGLLALLNQIHHLGHFGAQVQQRAVQEFNSLELGHALDLSLRLVGCQCLGEPLSIGASRNLFSIVKYPDLLVDPASNRLVQLVHDCVVDLVVFVSLEEVNVVGSVDKQVACESLAEVFSVVGEQLLRVELSQHSLMLALHLHVVDLCHDQCLLVSSLFSTRETKLAAGSYNY